MVVGLMPTSALTAETTCDYEVGDTYHATPTMNLDTELPTSIPEGTVWELERELIADHELHTEHTGSCSKPTLICIYAIISFPLSSGVETCAR